MNDKTRWWAEFGLDVAFTVIVGWFLLGAIAAYVLAPWVVDAKDPGEFAKAFPLLVQALVTYGVWKLARSFNWLQGTPPNPG